MELKGQEYIEKFFAENGYLADILDGYEYRESQYFMSRSILETFTNGGFFCCEAGTGIGKTISYLLPAIIWSLKFDERVLISTHTKNLQEQICTKDLPLISSIFPHPFRFSLVKGKGNYICLRRWKEYSAQPSLSLVPEEGNILEEISSWVDETSEGDLSHDSPLNPRLDRELWGRICCDTFFCSEQVCPDHRKCFLKKARRKALSANIVVINHSLLLADRMTDGAVLGDYECVIVDESQNLPRVAREGMKSDVDRWKLLWSVRSLMRIVRRDVDRQRISQIISRRTGQKILRLCRRLERSIGKFFSLPIFKLTDEFEEKPKFTQKSRYSGEDDRLRELRENSASLIGEMVELQMTIEGVIDDLDKEVEGEDLLEIQGYLDVLQERTEDLRYLLRADDDTRVYWIEKQNGDERASGSLNAVPVDVAPFLRDILFSDLRVGIFTSATLRIMDSFEFFMRSTGLDEMIDRFGDSAVFSSPFHYAEQAMVAVPSFLPDPRDSGYRDKLVKLLYTTILSLRRGTLILFTSIDLLDYCYHELKEGLEAEGIICLGQGIDGTRDRITRIFREEQKSVLFGTDSFWEGVDIQGESLEVLVFTRLPFSVPSDPIAEAIDESIRMRGGNPFIEYYLPNAVMKFRQGFGRLIRSGHDRGVALVMDNRILRQRYGEVFIESLPVLPIAIEREKEWLPTLHKWWS
jgi:Rad3-related DNA helicase